MAGPKIITARALAATALNQINLKSTTAGQILNSLLDKTEEKQRATNLVFGVIRNRNALDMIIAELADCPIKRISAKLLNIIRIAVYELIYCPLTPEHAIVNEAVETTKAFAGKKQVGFVNAVLRRIGRCIKNRQADLSDTNTKKILPQNFSTGCEFNLDILPDPGEKPADFLSSAFSLPKWLISEWLGEFGFEKTRQICFASNRNPSIYLRVNSLKTSIEQLHKKLRNANIESEVLGLASLKLNSPASIEKLPGFAEGQFIVQDVTAAKVIQELNPQNNWKILDLCAAPGTKTTQLAELTNNKATIVATDIDPQRLNKIKENTERLGINCVNITEYKNLKKIVREIGPFDCVFLDVPCSNAGVLAKRAEVRYRITKPAVKKLAKIQMKLLNKAATMLKPQGTICYSTCSIQPDENSDLIKQFLAENKSFELQKELLTLPSARQPDRDGGYMAIITKQL